MGYNRTFWEDTPSTNTPINAENLNNIEEGLVDHDERIEALEQGSGSGHIIVDENGNDMPAKSRMQFVGAEVTDESGKTVVTMPTKLSDLTNDTGFITNTVNNLTNYYKKSETYTQAEVDALISAIVTLNVLVVQTLPTQDISTTTIYLVPKATAGAQDVYDEYLYVNNAWEHIGSTEIDLSNYYTKTEVNALLSDKVDKVTGKQLSTEDFTSALKTKLEGIQAGAEANIQSDWNQTDTTADDYIKNKPTISPFDINTATPTFTEASTRANILSGETIPTLFGKIKKFFSDLKAVAFSGSYNDLSNKPTLKEGYIQEIDGSTVKLSPYYSSSAEPNLITISKDFVSKSSGGTFNGNVIVDRATGTTSATGSSAIQIGNNKPAGTQGNSRGYVELYGAGSYYARLRAGALSAQRYIDLPDESGTVALERGSYSREYTNQKWIDILSDFFNSRIDKTKVTLFSKLHVHGGTYDSFYDLHNSNCMNVSRPSYALFNHPLPGNGRIEAIYFDNSPSLNSFRKYVYNGNVDTDYSQDTVSVTLTMYY